MSSSSSQSMYPTIQCQNPACLRWNYNPIAGSKCVKCMVVLPIWVGYLNADKADEPYIPIQPLHRTDYQETWYGEDEEAQQEKAEKPQTSLKRSVTCSIDEPKNCTPMQLKRTDGNDQEEPLTNKEKVIQDIMWIYGLDREGAMIKIDQIVKSVVVEYF